MGIENMRRWPMYIVFAVCILLILSLLNSWSMETELRSRVAGISLQLQECSKQQESCVEESLTLTEQRNRYIDKVGDLDKQKLTLSNNLGDLKSKLSTSEHKINRTLVDLELCKTELQSLNNLQVSRSATLETLRLEKDTLTSQLEERKQRISELEKEVEKLKTEASIKSSPNVPPSPKVTPAAQPPKMSPALEPHAPIQESVLENNAKEEMEDMNVVDGGMDFDPQLQ